MHNIVGMTSLNKKSVSEFHTLVPRLIHLKIAGGRKQFLENYA